MIKLYDGRGKRHISGGHIKQCRAYRVRYSGHTFPAQRKVTIIHSHKAGAKALTWGCQASSPIFDDGEKSVDKTDDNEG